MVLPLAGICLILRVEILTIFLPKMATFARSFLTR